MTRPLIAEIWVSSFQRHMVTSCSQPSQSMRSAQCTRTNPRDRRYLTNEADGKWHVSACRYQLSVSLSHLFVLARGRVVPNHNRVLMSLQVSSADRESLVSHYNGACLRRSNTVLSRSLARSRASMALLEQPSWRPVARYSSLVRLWIWIWIWLSVQARAGSCKPT